MATPRRVLAAPPAAGARLAAGLRRLGGDPRRFLFEKDALRLMGLTMMVKPISLATQMLVAAFFGAGGRYDAYAFALFLATVMEGSLGRVFTSLIIPTAIQMRGDVRKRVLIGYQNASLLLFFGPGALIALVLTIWPGAIIDLLGPNLPADTRAHSVRMLPPMALGGLAFLVVAMCQALLNLNRRFLIAGAMPLLQAAVVLAVLLLGRNALGIWALPSGFVLGSTIQLLIVLSKSFRAGYLGWVRPVFPPGALTRIWSIGWALLAAEILVLAQVSVDKIFATGLPVGSISSISYSMMIVNLGVQMFNLSVLVVLFTKVSELIGAGHIAECSAYFLANLKRASRILVPFSLGLGLASREVVAILFERGAFTAADTERTAGLLTLYLLGLPAITMTSWFARVYHALQKMRDRLWLNVQFLVTNIVGNLLLVHRLGVDGLAISSTLSINIHLALNLLLLAHYRTGLAVGRFGGAILRAYGAGGAAWLLYSLTGYGTWLDGRPFGDSLISLVATAGSRIAFIGAVFFLVTFLISSQGFGNRLRRRPGSGAKA